VRLHIYIYIYIYSFWSYRHLGERVGDSVWFRPMGTLSSTQQMPEITLDAGMKKVTVVPPPDCMDSPRSQGRNASKTYRGYDWDTHLSSIKAFQKTIIPLVGNMLHHVRSSSVFIQTTSSVPLSPEDIMVNFDVISLFTIVPLGGRGQQITWGHQFLVGAPSGS
jgi:hypothetical protein